MGLAKRVSKAPRSNHSSPRAAATGCVIHAYMMMPGTSPPLKPYCRARPSSWILFSGGSSGVGALTWNSGRTAPAARCSKLMAVSSLRPLHRAGDETVGEVATEHVVEEHGRQGVDDGERHEEIPRGVVAGEEITHAHGEGDGLLALKEEHGVEILVPREEEGVSPDGDQRWRDEGEVDAEEHRDQPGAVHGRRLVDLRGNGLGVVPQHPQGVGGGEGGHGEDEGPVGVEEIEVTHDLEKRNGEK